MSGPESRPRRRGPRRATPEYLERAALFHLERYASSRENLRRLLLRKVARSAAAHGTDAAEGEAAVEALLAKLKRAGLLDDAAYAEGSARALRRRGASAAGVRAKLAAKGVERALADQALEAVAEELPGDGELAAAAAFARRRRLGPYRPATERAERRQRDLAALGRQGYAAEVARKVIDAADVAALQALVAEEE